jgi:hypothetical protein
MSISFWCPEAPKMSKEEREGEPSCSFQNHIAISILGLIGLPQYAVGEIKQDQLTEVQKSLIKVSNLAYRRKHLLKPPSLIYRLYDEGLTDEILVSKLIRLQTLVTYAQIRKIRIVWS